MQLHFAQRIVEQTTRFPGHGASYEVDKRETTRMEECVVAPITTELVSRKRGKGAGVCCAGYRFLQTSKMIYEFHPPPYIYTSR